MPRCHTLQANMALSTVASKPSIELPNLTRQLDSPMEFLPVREPTCLKIFDRFQKCSNTTNVQHIVCGASHTYPLENLSLTRSKICLTVRILAAGLSTSIRPLFDRHIIILQGSPAVLPHCPGTATGVLTVEQ